MVSPPTTDPFRRLWERHNRADSLDVFKMHKEMSLLPFHQFFRNSTVVTTRGLWPFSKDCQSWVPFRCATLLLLKPCYRPLEPVTSNSHRLLQCKLVQEWIGQHDIIEHGLLRGLAVR